MNIFGDYEANNKQHPQKRNSTNYTVKTNIDENSLTVHLIF